MLQARVEHSIVNQAFPSGSIDPILLYITPDNKRDHLATAFHDALKIEIRNNKICQLIDKNNNTASFVSEHDYNQALKSLPNPKLNAYGAIVLHIGLTSVLLGTVTSALSMSIKNIDTAKDNILLMNTCTNEAHGTFDSVGSFFVFLLANLDIWITSSLMLLTLNSFNTYRQSRPVQLSSSLRDTLPQKIANSIALELPNQPIHYSVASACNDTRIIPPFSTVILNGPLSSNKDVTWLEQVVDRIQVTRHGTVDVHPLVLFMSETDFNNSQHVDGFLKIKSRAHYVVDNDIITNSKALQLNHTTCLERNESLNTVDPAIGLNDVSTEIASNSMFESVFSRYLTSPLPILSKDHYFTDFRTFFNQIFKETNTIIDQLQRYSQTSTLPGLIDANEFVLKYHRNPSLGLVMGFESGSGKTFLMTAFGNLLLDFLNQTFTKASIRAVAIEEKGEKKQYFILGNDGKASLRLKQRAQTTFNLGVMLALGFVGLSAFSSVVLSMIFLTAYTKAASLQMERDEEDHHCMMSPPDPTRGQIFGTIYSGRNEAVSGDGGVISQHLIPIVQLFLLASITLIECLKLYQKWAKQCISPIKIIGLAHERESCSNPRPTIFLINRFLHGDSCEDVMEHHNNPHVIASLVPTNNSDVMQELSKHKFKQIKAITEHDQTQREPLLSFLRRLLKITYFIDIDQHSANQLANTFWNESKQHFLVNRSSISPPNLLARLYS
tara:strand:- start:196 stop:2364 length:2169 start_codon:yes stop_codon:yes gene_type:complete